MYRKNNQLSWRSIMAVIIFWMATFTWFNSAYAETQVNLPAGSTFNEAQKLAFKTAYQQLAFIQEKNAIVKIKLKKIQEFKAKKLASLQPAMVDEKLLIQSQMELANAKASLNDTQLSLIEAQRTVSAINANIRNLSDSLQEISLLTHGNQFSTDFLLKQYHDKLSYEKILLQIENARIKELTQSLGLAQTIVAVEQNWNYQINQLYQAKLNNIRQNEINQTIAKLQEERQGWLKKLSQYNAQLRNISGDDNTASSENYHLAMNILNATEQSNLLRSKLVLIQLEHRYHILNSMHSSYRSIASYNNAIKRCDLLMDDLNAFANVINRKITLLQQRNVIVDNSYKSGLIGQKDYQAYNQLLKSLASSYQEQLNLGTNLQNKLKNLRGNLKDDFTRELGRRQGLPGFNLSAWVGLGQQLTELPKIIYQSLAGIFDQIGYALQTTNFWNIGIIIALSLSALGLWFLFRRYLKIAAAQIKRKGRKLSVNIVYILLEIFRRNLLGFLLFSIFIFSLLLISVPYKVFMPLVQIGIIYFIFKIIIDLVKILLTETSVHVSEKDLKLYKAFKIVFILGGVLTAITLFVYQLPVPFEVRDFINRLFMFFLFAVSLLLLRGWQRLPEVLEPYLARKRSYIRRVIRLLSFLVPLSLLTTAIIGLLGYVDLAWTINIHIVLFLLVLSVYVLVRGLAMDILDWFSEVLIRNMRSGWLWTQAVMKPLESVVRIITLLFAIAVLFISYGWGRDSYVVSHLITFMHMPLFNIVGSEITPKNIIEFIIVVAIFYWAVRWSREFSYRWLFAKCKDVGLRNSLAIFAQYTMVIIGFFVLLWVLGISPFTLAAVLTVFAVGVAFGLRDIFKNYVSGIFLLIERPLRKGDFVTVGNYEGEVTYIGMRSFIVSTWDHVELFVPNSEVFDKPFTNWTLQDNIVRSVISVKINRVDDPHMVRNLIEEVLEQSENIVADPASQVFLKEIDDSLLEFEVRYYINLARVSSRAEVRSQTLFTIWDKFEQHGIKPPFPQQEVNVRGQLE